MRNRKSLQTRNDCKRSINSETSYSNPLLPNFSDRIQSYSFPDSRNSYDSIMSQDKNSNTKVSSASQNPPSKLDHSNLITTDVRQHNTDKNFTDKHIKNLFNSIFLAALTNRDTVLREVSDCIRLNYEQRCRAISEQMDAHWRNLSIKNGCIFIDNKVAIPNAIREAVIDLFHSTHPGSWGMKELAQRVWWPFCKREILNKVKTCKACNEYGKNLKSVKRKSEWKPLKKCC